MNTKRNLYDLQPLLLSSLLLLIYQGFVIFIDESIVEYSQTLISPNPHKLGDSQKPVKEKSGIAELFLKTPTNL